MACIAHPGRMTLVVQAQEPATGGLRVDGVFVLPAEPSVQIGGMGGGPITLSYRVMSLTETRERAVAAAKSMRAEGQILPHALCLALCLLDGLPTPEAPASASRAS